MGVWISRAATAASISRFHIVSIAFLGTFTFGWLFTGRYLGVLAGICAVDWFVVNLLNRVVDVPEDRENGIRGTDFVARRRGPILVLGGGVLAASLVLNHLWEPALTPFRVAYHALGMAYNWRLLPGKRRIKELYFFKNAASALGFLITVFAYPLAIHHGAYPPGVSTGTLVFVVAFFFLFELSYEAIYDLRDVAGDSTAGVRTYAVVHGTRGAVTIIDVMLVSAVLVLTVGYAVGAVPWRIYVMAFAPICQFFVYKRALHRGITSRDCIALTWLGASLLAVYHLWVVLDLPGVS